MNHSIKEVIIVGGGHAGLSASYYLKHAGIAHILFERGRVGETWRTQRWHSFKMNSINRLNILPGAEAKTYDPNAFSTHLEFVASLEDYVSTFKLPVAENAQVLSIDKPAGTDLFRVIVSRNNSQHEYFSRQLIIASGMQNESKMPASAINISENVMQIHSAEYRTASQLPGGAVLVVGSAQSGCQIVEDLIQAGRKVYFSTSMVGRIPRCYRGKDIMEWLLMMGFFDAGKEDIKNPMELQMKPPQLTGAGEMKHTISLQTLAQQGAIILGRMENADSDNVYFAANAKAHIKFADDFSLKVKTMIDGFLQKSGLHAPPPEFDIDDKPDLESSCATCVESLNLKDHNIHSVIWSTGFTGKFNYIKLPVLNAAGEPEHINGISPVKGLYFLGFPWLRTRKSALIHGIKEDAEFIIEKVKTACVEEYAEAKS